MNIQSADLQVLSIHDDIEEPQQHGEPELDHDIVHFLSSSAVFRMAAQRTFRHFQHHWHYAPKHSDSQQAYLLIFTDLAEFRDTYCDISKGAVLNYCREVRLIQSCDNFKC